MKEILASNKDYSYEIKDTVTGESKSYFSLDSKIMKERIAEEIIRGYVASVIFTDTALESYHDIEEKSDSAEPMKLAIFKAEIVAKITKRIEEKTAKKVLGLKLLNYDESSVDIDEVTYLG